MTLLIINDVMDLNIDIDEMLHHGNIFVYAPTDNRTIIRFDEPPGDHVYLDIANDAKAQCMQVQKIVAECGLPTPYVVHAYDHDIMFVDIASCLQRLATRQPSCKHANISLIGHGSSDGNYCLNNDRVPVNEIVRRLHELAEHYTITITAIFGICFGHFAKLYPTCENSALEIVYFTTDDNPYTIQNHRVRRQADTGHVVDSTHGQLLDFYRSRYTAFGREIDSLISSMKLLTICD